MLQVRKGHLWTVSSANQKAALRDLREQACHIHASVTSMNDTAARLPGRTTHLTTRQPVRHWGNYGGTSRGAVVRLLNLPLKATSAFLNLRTLAACIH
jgi:hypothetical protein